MNDNQLKTFIITAESGSFSKAAEQLFISPSAVIKQINILEKDIEFALFERTHRGLRLTKAGEVFYKDVRYITQYMEDALRRARSIGNEKDNVIRIGTSFMTPSQFIVELWPKIYEQCPKISFQMIPFENKPEIAANLLQNMGEKIDIVAGIFDDAFLEECNCAALELERAPIQLAVPVKHPLAAKERMLIEDLYGQDLMINNRGWLCYLDELRDYLLENHPKINIVDFDFYNVNLFNQCESNNAILTIINQWEHVHPLMKAVPVEWDFRVPFGIIHAKNPTENVRRFLNAVQTII